MKDAILREDLLEEAANLLRHRKEVQKSITGDQDKIKNNKQLSAVYRTYK